MAEQNDQNINAADLIRQMSQGLSLDPRDDAKSITGSKFDIQSIMNDLKNKNSKMAETLQKILDEIEKDTEETEETKQAILELKKIIKKTERIEKIQDKHLDTIGKALQTLNKNSKQIKDQTTGAEPLTKDGIGNKSLIKSNVLLGAAVVSAVEIVSQFRMLDKIKQGILVDDYQFYKNLNQIAFETKGLNKETSELLAGFRNLSKTTGIVAQTGYDLSTYQELYVENIRKGIRSQKEYGGVLKASLGLSTLIGSEAGDTADTLTKWSREFNINEKQTARISREVQQIAKDTGITGNNLLNAVKSSEIFLRNMVNAGVEIRSASRATMGLMASAQKFGIEDRASQLLTAMSSSNKFLMETDKGTQAFLARLASGAGLMNELRQGTILNVEGAIGRLGDSFENMLGGFGVTSEMIENGKVNERSLIRLNALAKQFGFEGIGEMTKLMKAMREQAKPLKETLGELNKKLEANNLTSQERLNIAKKISSLKEDRTLDLAGRLSSIMEKTNKNMGEASIDLFNELKTKGELKNLSGTDIINESDSSKLLNNSLITLSKGLKDKSVGQQIEAMITSGNDAKVREGIEKLTEEIQKQKIEDKKNLDPVGSAIFELSKINETIRNSTFGILSATASILTGTMLIVGYVALMIPIMLSIKALLAKQFLKDIIPGKERGLKGMLRKWTGGFLAEDVATKTKKPAMDMRKLSQSAIPNKTSAADDFLNKLTTEDLEITELVDKTQKTSTGFFAKITKGFSSFLNGIFNISLRWFPKTTKIFHGLITGIGRALMLGVRAIPVVGWAIAIAATLGEAAYDAFENSEEKARAIFEKSNEQKLKSTERWAAQSGIFITGLLNSITFGIFGSYIGPTGTLTKMLVKFIESIAPLNYVLAAVGAVLKIVYGVVKGVVVGLWEVVKGLAEGVWEIVSPFVDLFNLIFGGVFDFAGKILKSFGIEIESTFDLVENISGIIIHVGKTIGFVLKAIGTIIGGVFRLVGAIVTGDGQAIMNVISETWNKLVKSFQFNLEGFGAKLGDWVYGIVSGFWTKIKKSFMAEMDFIYSNIKNNKVLSAIHWLVMLIPNSISFMVNEVIKFFNHLVNILVGNSIVPDLVDAIIWWFLKLPVAIIKAIASIPIKVFKLMLSLGNYIKEGIENVISDFKNGFAVNLLNSVNDLWKNVLAFSERTILRIPNIISGAFTYVVRRVSDYINRTLESLYDKMSNFVDFMLSPLKYLYNKAKEFSTYIAEKISSGFSYVKNIIVEYSISIYESVKNTFNSMYEYMNGILNSIGSVVQSSFNYIKEKMYASYEFVKNILSEVGNTLYDSVVYVKDTFLNIKDSIINFVSSIPSAIKNMFANTWLGKLIFGSGDTTESASSASQQASVPLNGTNQLLNEISRTLEKSLIIASEMNEKIAKVALVEYDPEHHGPIVAKADYGYRNSEIISASSMVDPYEKAVRSKMGNGNNAERYKHEASQKMLEINIVQANYLGMIHKEVKELKDALRSEPTKEGSSSSSRSSPPPVTLRARWPWGISNSPEAQSTPMNIA